MNTSTLELEPSPKSTSAIEQVNFDLQSWEDRLAEAEQLALQLTEDGFKPTVDYFLPNDFKLSVVVPVFNEEATIATVVQQLQALPFRTEIVIVDDCSTDGTRDVLARLAHICDIQILYHTHNQGKGAAIRSAIPTLTGDIVVIQDADLEYYPSDLIEVIRPVVEGSADVCYGSRFLNPDNAQNSSPIHRLGNRMLTMLSNWINGTRLTDMETCYKAFHRKTIQSIRVEQNRFGFEPEITAKLARKNVRFEECPISYEARGWSEGKKIGLKDAMMAVWCIIRYRFA